MPSASEVTTSLSRASEGIPFLGEEIRGGCCNADRSSIRVLRSVKVQLAGVLYGTVGKWAVSFRECESSEERREEQREEPMRFGAESKISGAWVSW